MRVANINRVSEIVAAAAAEFRALCIRQTGAIFVRSTNLSRVMLPLPPLRCDLAVGDADLTDLPRAFYMTKTALSVDEIAWVFNEYFNVKLAHDHHAEAPRAALHAVYPGLPFTTPVGASVVCELAQFLYVAGWYGHRCVVRAGSISTAGFTLASTSIERPQGYRKLKRSLGIAVPKLLGLTLRPAVYGAARTGAVYQYLLSTLPDMQAQIDAVVGAAAHAGSVQEILWRAFDVEHRHIETPRGYPEIKQALATLVRAKRFPYAYMQSLLVPIMGAPGFEAEFGFADDWKGTYYSKVHYERHWKFLLTLKAQMIEEAHDEPNPTLDGSKAVSLQHMIR